MGSKDRSIEQRLSSEHRAHPYRHCLIREVAHLEDLDHDMPTEISDIEAAERTSRYISADIQPYRIVSLR